MRSLHHTPKQLDRRMSSLREFFTADLMKVSGLTPHQIRTLVEAKLLTPHNKRTSKGMVRCWSSVQVWRAWFLGSIPKHTPLETRRLMLNAWVENGCPTQCFLVMDLDANLGDSIFFSWESALGEGLRSLVSGGDDSNGMRRYAVCWLNSAPIDNLSVTETGVAR